MHDFEPHDMPPPPKRKKSVLKCVFGACRMIKYFWLGLGCAFGTIMLFHLARQAWTGTLDFAAVMEALGRFLRVLLFF